MQTKTCLRVCGVDCFPPSDVTSGVNCNGYCTGKTDTPTQYEKIVETKVTPGQINALMQRVAYRTESPYRTTTTFVHAFLDDKFFLASGMSACVDPANYDAQIGYDMALKNARQKAENELWKLEGYALYNKLQGDK